MVISQPRPGRRRGPLRRILLVAAVVVTLVSVAVWASVSAPAPKGRAVESVQTYLAELAQPLAQESELAGVVAHLRSDGATLDRVALVTSLVELDETAQRTADLVVSDRPVGRIPLDASALVDAAGQWAVGARQLEIGMLASIGPGRTTPPAGPGVVLPARDGAELWSAVSSVVARSQAASALSHAASSFADGDRSYGGFASSARTVLPRKFRGKGLVPRVQWVADPSAWTPTSMAVFRQDLATSPSLAPAHQVGLLLVSTSPQPIPSSAAGGVPTIVGNGAVTVTAVVADSGNVDEPVVSLSASLVASGPPAGGGPLPAPVTRTKSVTLLAGEHLSVIFSRLSAPPGSTYTLTVSVVPPAGQASAAGTTVTRTFAVAP